jgi:hypothetical protein
MVALGRERRGRGWAPGQRDARAAPSGHAPGSGSCGPARRPGPRRLGDGSARAPRHARVLEPGQHQAGWPFGHSRARSCVPGRAGGPGLAVARLRAGPGLGCASARADRGWDLAAAGRLGSARRSGSGVSSKSRPRTAEPLQRSSGSVLTTGHPSGRDAGRAALARGGDRRPPDPVSVPWCARLKFVTVCQVSLPGRPQRGRAVVDGGDHFRDSMVET